MRYGITGNTGKDNLWAPAAELTRWLMAQQLSFCLHENVARGLAERALLDAQLCAEKSESDLADASDVILSFGGDGTLLNSAHEVGSRGTPILGINIGRLGFLAEIEVGQMKETILRLEQGDYRIERRMVLEAHVAADIELATSWAVNEYVIERSGSAKLISIDVSVNGTFLNTYWADGLIIATPTGSTAYSLSTGGPIMMPGCGTILLTPIAPHMLTVRPLVIPDDAVLTARLVSNHEPYVLAADGISTQIRDAEINITVRRARHTVNLVKLPEQHYFNTIRSKLMWGARKHN